MDPDQLKEKIREIYREHNPDKLPHVERLFSKYKGEEQALLDKVTKEYAELSQLGIHPGLKWLRDTTWTAELVDGPRMGTMDFTCGSQHNDWVGTLYYYPCTHERR